MAMLEMRQNIQCRVRFGHPVARRSQREIESMKATEKSDRLYDAIVAAIDKHKRGMTTYQIIGVLVSVTLRWWERFAKQPPGSAPFFSRN